MTAPPPARADRDAQAKISFKHVLWSTLTGVFIFVGLTLLVWWISGTPNSRDWFDIVLRNVVLGFGALGAVPAGYIAYRRQRTLEQQRQDDRDKRVDELDRLSLERKKEEARLEEVAEAKRQAESTESRRLQELEFANARADFRDYRARYSEAAAQLGHASAAVRLAGVYAMAQLADEWGEPAPAQRQTCIDVLCAYLRMEPMEGDDEVRSTLVGSIASHLRRGQGISWSENNFDFRAAKLKDFSLNGATFRGQVEFALSTFFGFTDLREVTFSGQMTSFTSAAFFGAVHFEEARFSGARTYFSGAKFVDCDVDFAGAWFSGISTSFREAKFSGARTRFSRATFNSEDTFFEEAIFSGARTHFDGATFSGTRTHFDGATFSGTTTTFNGAMFSGGRKSFEKSTFSGASTSFDGTTFSGGSATFNGATFSGGTVTFKGARFSGATTAFGATVGSTLESGDTVFVRMPARIGNRIDFQSARTAGRAELDLSGAEVAGMGEVVAPIAFTIWKPPRSGEPARLRTQRSD